MHNAGLPCGTVFQTYSKARYAIRKAGRALESHHILEARHLKYWKLSTNAPTVVLTRKMHQRITKILRNKLPYGVEYSKSQVWKAYESAYNNYPHWLKAIEHYFK